MSWRATVPCSRAQAEAIGDTDHLLETTSTPVLVADEPDPACPDAWVIHAYFDHQPNAGELAELARLGRGPAKVEKLGEEDWVTLSQSGLEPIRAGRFHVHTPTYAPEPGRVNFEIDAGLAFGTGQHATTAGCLEVLDKLERDGIRFRNIADIGTGTGILAFASLAIWPAARCIGTDIDQVAIDVAEENASINGVKVGHGPGELLLGVAEGMDSPLLAARAPFDLIIANILAGPLIELAPAFAEALGPGGTIILAGLLDSQAIVVADAYGSQGLIVAPASDGEWPVLMCTNRT